MTSRSEEVRPVKSTSPTVVAQVGLVTNPWLTLRRKDVSFDGKVEDYYSLTLPDYVAIVARTPTGKIPLVRQYRPAVEQFTWELPAGTVGPGETPLQCALRELQEEVGLTGTATSLGSYWPDTGRLENQLHVFAIECRQESAPADFVPEAGLEIGYLTPAELRHMVATNSFNHVQHVAALYLARVLP